MSLIGAYGERDIIQDSDSCVVGSSPTRRATIHIQTQPDFMELCFFVEKRLLRSFSYLKNDISIVIFTLLTDNF